LITIVIIAVAIVSHIPQMIVVLVILVVVVGIERMKDLVLGLSLLGHLLFDLEHLMFDLVITIQLTRSRWIL